MRKIQIIIICLTLILLGCSSVQGVAPTPHISNATPACGAEDVVITAKGLQTCVNVTIDSGCTVNISFLWFNWSDWPATPPQYELYGEYINVSASGQYCAWDNNVSCATENDWMTWWHWWRVVANFTCPQTTYTEIFYCNFNPEECVLFYIYPPNNSTDICPCCDGMCIGITNENGNNMNLSFYRNDTMNETFYLVNKYINVSNNTYCFCIDGHIGDIYYPMRYNETYHWYVNVTDVVTGSYDVSNIYWFTTAENLSDCICLNASTYADLDTSYYKAFVIGLLGLIGLLGILKKRKKENRE